MAEPIHGERVVDGNAGTLTALLLYKAGSTTAYTLKSTEVLHITHVTILCEAGGDVALIAGDTAGGGAYIVEGSLAATGGLTKEMHTTPFVCPPGVVPYFSGAGTNKSTCIIEGFIRAA